MMSLKRDSSTALRKAQELESRLIQGRCLFRFCYALLAWLGGPSETAQTSTKTRSQEKVLGRALQTLSVFFFDLSSQRNSRTTCVLILERTSQVVGTCLCVHL